MKKPKVISERVTDEGVTQGKKESSGNLWNEGFGYFRLAGPKSVANTKEKGRQVSQVLKTERHLVAVAPAKL